ncbi:mitochondrial import receptor subunit [Phlyctema vagabunda]|uniref:Mitochondrial import receptor subunit n=1 Tax=Phlyctema vagabunda TaxID=108571 RepID=A0ABR4P4A5_9HELO
MVLELHVWGPAFGLPSIDAPCLAAIAYLQKAVPRGQWQLIASNELPALRNGDVWIGGFRNIFHYVAQYSAGEWELDIGLGEQAGADCIAFSSFMEAQGQPLLDLSLYVSSENYTTVTRPTYNTIQSFPLPYLTPPSVRALAKARTAHLGLDSLDIDKNESSEGTGKEKSIIPESLRKPRNTVTSLLASSPENAAQIRLDALATTFFEPLQQLRGEKRFFVSTEQFSSLDCLAVGYLSLMLRPDLPQPWLAKTMRKKYPDLCDFVDDVSRLCFGAVAVKVEDAFLEATVAARQQERDGRKSAILPWKPPPSSTPISVATTFVSTMFDSLPIVGQFRRNTRMRQSASSSDATSNSNLTSIPQKVTMVGAVGLLVGYYAIHQGLLPALGSAGQKKQEEQEQEQEKKGLNDFGEAGAALAALAGHLDMQADMEREQERRAREAQWRNETGTGGASGPVMEVGVQVARPE